MSKLAIYAGHGGKDPGAVTGSRKEKDYTLRVMKVVTAHMKAAGHTVINNRTTDVDRSITADATRANNEGVDYICEIHLNSNEGTPGTGTETYYYGTSVKGQQMATAVNSRIVALGFKNRGAKSNTSLGILVRSKAPAILVETAFINNDADMKLYDVDKMGNAITQGLLDVIGGKVSSSAPNKTETAEAKPSTPASGKDRIKTLQTELNTQFKARLAVDGIWGPKTEAACVKVRSGARGNLTTLIQQCVGVSADGIFGTKTEAAVKAFQRSKGLTADGIVGRKTWKTLMSS